MNDQQINGLVKPKIMWASICPFCGHNVFPQPSDNEARAELIDHLQHCSHDPSNRKCGSCVAWHKESRLFVELEDVVYQVSDTDVTYQRVRLCPKVDTLVEAADEGCASWAGMPANTSGQLIIEKKEEL